MPRTHGSPSMQLGLYADPAALAGFTEPPFDFVEGHVQNLLKPDAPDAEFSAGALSAAGRPMPAACCFLPASLKVTGPAIDHAHLARYADTAFRRATQAGIRIIVFGSGAARQAPEGWSLASGFEQYVAALRLIAPVAERHGITVVVEPLNRGECNLVNTLLEGAVAVARAAHPSIRLLADIFHMLRNDEPPEDIVKVGPWLAHTHIAENVGRAPPGVHGDDFRPYLRALKQAGYAGRLTVECNWSSLRRQVGPSFAALRAQLADAGF